MISSAHWIAAARARESSRDDRLFDDPWAAALAGERGVTMLAASERASGGENAYLPVRTRYFDEQVAALVQHGIDQVVVLGAGLDTRPFRMALPRDLTWFEVDRPELFATKEPILADAVASCTRLAVPADLSGEWLPALRAAGFDAALPTAWLGEGLLFYLAPEAVDALLTSAAAESAPGSRFLADVMPPDVPGMDTYRAYCAANGQPGPYGHDDPAALFAANGWMIEHVTWAGAPDANYGRFVRRVASPTARTGRAHLVTGVRRAPAAG